jgi:hypothetical protein
MTRKRKRRSSVVEIGTGPARVKIYTNNRKDGTASSRRPFLVGYDPDYPPIDDDFSSGGPLLAPLLSTILYFNPLPP